jgi:hypothetical protein
MSNQPLKARSASTTSARIEHAVQRAEHAVLAGQFALALTDCRFEYRADRKREDPFGSVGRRHLYTGLMKMFSLVF